MAVIPIVEVANQRWVALTLTLNKLKRKLFNFRSHIIAHHTFGMQAFRKLGRKKSKYIHANGKNIIRTPLPLMVCYSISI